MKEKQVNLGLQILELEFGKKQVQNAVEAIAKFKVEIPSWIFGAFGGGRFSGYMPPGFARDIYEKLDDAQIVHKLTGAADQVAVHVLWDLSKNEKEGDLQMANKINEAACERGLKIGSVSPTYFLKGSHTGSLSSRCDETRENYISQTIFAGEVAKKIGSNLITIWLHDGSLYPGQIELRKAIELTIESLLKAYDKIDRSVRILIEYKLFEPGTYSTVFPDWGSAYMAAKNLGPNAGVLVDLGHHPWGVNVEQIVARLIYDGIHGGFHFNSRFAADDDHAVEPNEVIARIFYELVTGDVLFSRDSAKNWDYMIDQCSGRENRIHAILYSIDSLQSSLAKALLVDREKLQDFQSRDEIILAAQTFNDALIHADVRPIVAASRLERNLPADPLSAYVESGYQSVIESKRK